MQQHPTCMIAATVAKYTHIAPCEQHQNSYEILNTSSISFLSIAVTSCGLYEFNINPTTPNMHECSHSCQICQYSPLRTAPKQLWNSAYLINLISVNWSDLMWFIWVHDKCNNTQHVWMQPQVSVRKKGIGQWYPVCQPTNTSSDLDLGGCVSTGMLAQTWHRWFVKGRCLCPWVEVLTSRAT